VNPANIRTLATVVLTRARFALEVAFLFLCFTIILAGILSLLFL